MNYVTFSLILAAVLNGAIGVYVLLSNYRGKFSRLFFAAITILVWWHLCTLKYFTSKTFFWVKAGSFSMVFLPSIFLQLSLIFPRDKEIYKKSSYLKYAIYIPSTFFLFLNFTNSLVKDVKIYQNEVVLIYGSFFPFFAFYFISFCFLGLYILSKSYIFEEDKVIQKQLGYFIFGVSITIFISLFTNLILPILGIFDYLVLSNISTIFMSGFVGYAILKYPLISLAPKTETITEEGIGIHLERGISYLLKGKNQKNAMKIFTNLVRMKCYDCHHNSFECESIGCEDCSIECPCKTCKKTRPQGLVVTRTFPEHVRKKYLLQTTPVVWLSQLEGYENSIHPTNLPKLTFTILEFVKNSKNPVVILDGLEYLIIQNGFSQTLKTLYSINDIVMHNNALLLIPINPESLSDTEISLLEREFRVF